MSRAAAWKYRDRGVVWIERSLGAAAWRAHPSPPPLSPPTPSQSGAADNGDDVRAALDRASLEQLLAGAAADAKHRHGRVQRGAHRRGDQPRELRRRSGARAGPRRSSARAAAGASSPGCFVGVDGIEAFLGLARHLSGEGPAMTAGAAPRRRWFAHDAVGDGRTAYAIFALWRCGAVDADRAARRRCCAPGPPPR